jgi:hypothetical protein
LFGGYIAARMKGGGIPCKEITYDKNLIMSY